MRKGLILLIVVFLMAGYFAVSKGNELPADKSATTRIVRDGAGKEVVIPLNPKRVLFLSATHLDLFVAAGGKDKVVGIPTSQTLSQEVKTAISGVQEIGMTMAPNTEVMMALNPDLVIGVNFQPHAAIVPLFEKAGIPVYLHGIDSYEQVLAHLRLYGELAGTADVAAKKILNIKSQYDMALKKSSGKKAPVTLILWGTPDSFSMGTKKSFVGDLVERLGGGNMLDKTDQADTNSSYLPLSMEYVTTADPEVILLITHGSPEGLKAKFSREMKDSPVWQNVSATKNKRMYTLPYQIFAVNPGSRIGDAINILADYMYGENE